MEIEKLEVPTVSEEVYKHLKIKIIKGELSPGEKITIRQLADSMGVSTMPVRESLRKLEVEGFVRYERRSVVVNKLSTNEVREIFEIRKRIEGLAIEWAVPNLFDKDIAILKSILQEIDLNLNDEFEWERLNKKFHLTLYSYSKSKSLNKVLIQLWGNVEPYMHIYSSNNADYSVSNAQKDHYLMLSYIENNQIDKLIALTMKHLSNTCIDIIKQIETKESSNK